MMFSRTLRPANGCVIWKVRTMPARADAMRRQAGDVAARRSATLPASGVRKPAISRKQRRLAGAVRADQRRRSRPARTSSEARSTAFRPPNDLERSRTSSMASASLARPPEQAHQAVGQAGRTISDQHDAVDDEAERLDVLQRRHDAGQAARHLVDDGAAPPTPISGPKMVPAPPIMLTSSISTDLSTPKAMWDRCRGYFCT